MIYKLIIEIINKIKSIGDSLFTSHIDEDLEKDLDFDKNDLYKFICVVLYKMNDEDKTLQLILEYVKQNNKILRANYSLLQENNALLKYIKNEIDREFSTENLLKVEGVIFLANIVANVISNIIYHDYFEDKSKYKQH